MYPKCIKNIANIATRNLYPKKVLYPKYDKDIYHQYTKEANNIICVYIYIYDCREIVNVLCHILGTSLPTTVLYPQSRVNLSQDMFVPKGGCATMRERPESVESPGTYVTE